MFEIAVGPIPPVQWYWGIYTRGKSCPSSLTFNKRPRYRIYVDLHPDITMPLLGVVLGHRIRISVNFIDKLMWN
jgi:hypothetical protein